MTSTLPPPVPARGRGHHRRVETGPRAAPQAWTSWLAPLLLVAALVCWFLGLEPVAPSDLGGVGLIAVLSPLVLVSYPLVVAAGLVELTGRARPWLLATITTALLLLVYGLQPATQEQARLPVGWLHVGFADRINQAGEVIPHFDTRFSWPGFFSFVAYLGRVAGLEDTAPLLLWAPLVLTGLAAVGVRALAGAVLGSRRAAWLATWVFLAGNWSEQDYLSPQGLAYVLLLVALALVVRFLARPGVFEPPPPRGARAVPAATATHRIAAHLVVLLLSLALSASHQLTPFLFGGLLLVLALWRRVSWWLPVTALVPPVAWFVLAARDFWEGQLDLITGSIGDLGASVDAGIGARLVGDPGHELIVKLRIALTGGLLLLAALGWWVRRRRGSRSWLFPALALASFGLAVLQPYGGEMFVRCFLFSLPWLAIGCALLGERLLSGRRTVGSALVVGVVLSALVLGTVTARGGNDAYTSVTTADVQAMDWIYEHAAPGSEVVAVTWYAPLRRARVADLTQISAEELWYQSEADCAELTEEQCLVHQRPDYVLMNPQQEASGVILDGQPRGWTLRVADHLRGTGYRVGYEQDGVLVLISPEVPQ